ncbi:MAG: DUF357 domain-containing protein [Candidatus Bathyarchaeota archaeon]
MSKESLNEKYFKYLGNLKKAFSTLSLVKNFNINVKIVEDILDLAKRYVSDAEYYKGKDDLTTALLSLSYSEGLLDALRMLGIVNFRWEC